MALATQNANLVRQKVYSFVYGKGTTTNPMSPGHFYAVKALFLHLAANKSNPDLQYVPFTASQIVVNGGYTASVTACTLYAFFGRARRTTGTTASFIAMHDAVDNNSAAILANHINATGQSFLNLYPDGKPFATDITVSAATTIGGATESSATDAVDGFYVVGA